MHYRAIVFWVWMLGFLWPAELGLADPGLANRGLAGEPVRLRVLSYNIHHAEGIDGTLDLERIAGIISRAAPDVVALQEVDSQVRRSGSVDQPAELARLTEMHVAFGGNIDLQGGRYGNAVLSRFPIQAHENHRLPNFADGEQRGLLMAEIDVPGLEDRLLLLATHFDHRRDDRERLASAKAVNQRVAEQAQQPALLVGDLNDVHGSPTLEELAKQWLHTTREPLPTIPVATPTRQIDFVLCRPPQRWKVIEVQVLDEAVASDHRPILAVLELLPEAPQ
ncbi:endonuclease/exonuclease/phosphatase family protein [Candidatus Laterigemmans baculatus]|uniref:endonuclease/exonuclease/phosphatase family protein n=1 Tax=Candidatus Laterigemmans baculatus TaxID=2770505 RepID=UPI0013DA21E6|nr:endonuclease/exonuclease/phosphatase family protein [Candidatus Laterigemmans baculatus]